MTDWMNIILIGGVGIVALNIIKPDILPPFLQVPALQNLIPAPGGATDPTATDPTAGDGTDPTAQGGGKKHKRKGKGKHKHSNYAYAAGYGTEFYG